jgi:hypothetical protein
MIDCVADIVSWLHVCEHQHMKVTSDRKKACYVHLAILSDSREEAKSTCNALS